MSTVVDLDGLLEGLAADTKAELASKPDVIDGDDNLDVSKLPPRGSSMGEDDRRRRGCC